MSASHISLWAVVVLSSLRWFGWQKVEGKLSSPVYSRHTLLCYHFSPSFETGAIAVYALWGWSTDISVLSVRCATKSRNLLVLTRSPHRPWVVVLLAMDVWTCRVRAISSIVLLLVYLILRNVSGRATIGLRFWNQVDEDGESDWVFESRGRRNFSAVSITVLNSKTACLIAITPGESNWFKVCIPSRSVHDADSVDRHLSLSCRTRHPSFTIHTGTYLS
jgi:hypothetical protein